MESMTNLPPVPTMTDEEQIEIAAHGRQATPASAANQLHKSPQGPLVSDSESLAIRTEARSGAATISLPEQGRLPQDMEERMLSLLQERENQDAEARIEQQEGGERWRFSEEIVNTLNNREEDRLEQRYSRGLIGKMHHGLNRALENNKGLKTAGKILLGGAAVGGAFALAGTAGMIAAPLLFSLGAKIGFSGLIEGVQEVTVLGSARRNLLQRKEAFEVHSRGEVQDLHQEFSHLQAGDITPDQFYASAEHIMRGLEAHEQGIREAENDNIALEARHKKIRGLASTGASIALGMFTGVPLGVQHFHGLPDLIAAKATAVHHGLAGAVNATAAGQTPHEVIFRAGDAIRNLINPDPNSTHSAFQFLYDRASEHVGKAPLHVNNLLGIVSHNLGHLPPAEAFAGLGIGVAGLIAKTAEELMHSAKGVGRDGLINTLKGLDARSRATVRAPGQNGFVTEIDREDSNILNSDVRRLGGYPLGDQSAPSYLAVLERLTAPVDNDTSQSISVRTSGLTTQHTEEDSVSTVDATRQNQQILKDTAASDLEQPAPVTDLARRPTADIVSRPANALVNPIGVPISAGVDRPSLKTSEVALGPDLDKVEPAIVLAMLGYDRQINSVDKPDVIVLLGLHEGTHEEKLAKIIRALSILNQESVKRQNPDQTERISDMQMQLIQIRKDLLKQTQRIDEIQPKPHEHLQDKVAEGSIEQSEDDIDGNEESGTVIPLNEMVSIVNPNEVANFKKSEAARRVDEFLRLGNAGDLTYLKNVHENMFGKWKDAPIGQNFIVYSPSGKIDDVRRQTEQIRQENPRAEIKVFVGTDGKEGENRMTNDPDYKLLSSGRNNVTNSNSIFVQSQPNLLGYLKDVAASEEFDTKHITYRIID